MGRQPGRNPHTIYRHNLMRKRFAQLGKITTKNGKQKHTFAAKIEILHKEFGFAEDTLETIVCQPMETDNQLNLF